MVIWRRGRDTLLTCIGIVHLDGVQLTSVDTSQKLSIGSAKSRHEDPLSLELFKKIPSPSKKKNFSQVRMNINRVGKTINQHLSTASAASAQQVRVQTTPFVSTKEAQTEYAELSVFPAEAEASSTCAEETVAFFSERFGE